MRGFKVKYYQLKICLYDRSTTQDVQIQKRFIFKLTMTLIFLEEIKLQGVVGYLGHIIITLLFLHLLGLN